MALNLVTEEQSQVALEQMVSDSVWGSSSSPTSRGQELDGLGMRAGTAWSFQEKRQDTVRATPPASIGPAQRWELSPHRPPASVRRLGSSGKTDISSVSRWWLFPPCLTPFSRTVILRLLRRSSYCKAFSCSLQYAPCKHQNILVGRRVPLGYHGLRFYTGYHELRCV